MIQKYKSLNINSLKTRTTFFENTYDFSHEHVRLSGKT